MKKTLSAALAAALLLAGCAKSEDEKTIYAIGVLANDQLKVFALTPAEFDGVLSGLRAAATGKVEAQPDDQARMEIQRLAIARQAAGDAAAQKAATTDPKTFHAIGVTFFEWFKQFNLKPKEFDLVFAGMRDGAAGKPEVKVADKKQDIDKLVQARQAAMGVEAQKQGAAYQEKAAKEPGAQKTASGLIYVPVKEGTGASPVATDGVKVHYTGKLVDGTVFDSSLKRGAPASFPLSGVIACWTEGVQKIKVGGKARLVCPPAIAYGDRGAPGAIPPGATLDFEVELLEILK